MQEQKKEAQQQALKELKVLNQLNEKELSKEKTYKLKKDISKSTKDTLPKVLFDAYKSWRNPPKKNAQDTIPYINMYEDGVCQVDDTTYSKMIEFYDINYQLAHREIKNELFEDYCSFLNYFDENVKVQMTFINEKIDVEERRNDIIVPLQNDFLDCYRKEYTQLLVNQMQKGTNGLTRRKYITFSVSAQNIKEAKSKLYQIETDVMNNFKLMGVQTVSIDGKQRLAILYKMMNPDERKFKFSWDEKNELQCSTKDFIAPKTFNFEEKNSCRVGKKYWQTQQMIISATELSDRTLADFLNMDMEIVINIHIEPIENEKAKRQLRLKHMNLNAMKIEQQQKAIRSGYDMDIMPAGIGLYINETEQILDALNNHNERWFEVSIIVTSIENTLDELETSVIQTQGYAHKKNCEIKPCAYAQEDCFASVLPLGINKMYLKRGLTTSSLAVFVPFTTQELFQTGESVYYGINALSNNMIKLNRKLLKNPNAVFLGVPGSGKSFSAKREMTDVILNTKDDVIICDPEDEYRKIIEAYKGQVIDISSASNNYINPLDINMDYSDEDNPLYLKADFVISMMELICGGKKGLSPKEISYIDRCVGIIYQKYLENPIPENIPILEDLYVALKNQNAPESIGLADAMEMYVYGSQQVFNHRTNVDITNRIVCFNIKELGKNLRQLGMLIIQDQVWNRVSSNRNKKVSTWFYVDEFHLLLKEKQTAAYSVEIWKRFRKWGGIPTGITQNVKDFLASKEIENILENSTFIYLLSQGTGGDKEYLARKLNISDKQLIHITNSPPGEGLLVYDGVILPFKDKIPEENVFYKLFNTRLESVSDEA